MSEWWRLYFFHCVGKHLTLELNANLLSQFCDHSVFLEIFALMAPGAGKLNIWYVQFLYISRWTQSYAMMALCLTQELPTDKTSSLWKQWLKFWAYFKLFTLLMLFYLETVANLFKRKVRTIRSHSTPTCNRMNRHWAPTVSTRSSWFMTGDASLRQDLENLAHWTQSTTCCFTNMSWSFHADIFSAPLSNGTLQVASEGSIHPFGLVPNCSMM